MRVVLDIAGDAQYLVTGDKNDLLAIQSVRTVRIVTARQLLEMLAKQ